MTNTGKDTPMAIGLAGRIALVTGAGGGIGAAVVRRLCAEGTRVAAIDIAAPGIDALAQELGPAVRAHALDVSDGAAIEAAVAEIEQSWGAIDLGVSVAGILATDPVVDTDDATCGGCSRSTRTGCFIFRAPSPGG